MKKFLYGLLLFTFVPVLQTKAEEATREEWTKPSSVRVCTKLGTNGFSCGSGTVIKKDETGYYIITCFHVVDDGTGKDSVAKTQIKTEYSPDFVWAKVKWHWKERDLALLFVKEEDDPNSKVVPAKLAETEDYRPETLVVKCGYPGARDRSVIAGYCTGKTVPSMFDKSYNSTLIKIRSRGGDSGGGLFRDKDHAFIGTVWGSDTGEQLMITRIEDIHTMLNFIKKEEEKKQPKSDKKEIKKQEKKTDEIILWK